MKQSAPESRGREEPKTGLKNKIHEQWPFFENFEFFFFFYLKNGKDMTQNDAHLVYTAQISITPPGIYCWVCVLHYTSCVCATLCAVVLGSCPAVVV